LGIGRVREDVDALFVEGVREESVVLSCLQFVSKLQEGTIVKLRVRVEQRGLLVHRVVVD